MYTPGKRDKKDLNFELNLLPVFDVMAACTCFLLMTAVWIQLGSFDVSQALGGQSIAETKNPPSIWAYMNQNGQVVLALKEISSPLGRDIAVPGQQGQIAWKSVKAVIQKIQKRHPQIKTALIMPADVSKYDDVVHMMDQFRGNGVSNIGISPL